MAKQSKQPPDPRGRKQSHDVVNHYKVSVPDAQRLHCMRKLSGTRTGMGQCAARIGHLFNVKKHGPRQGFFLKFGKAIPLCRRHVPRSIEKGHAWSINVRV